MNDRPIIAIRKGKNGKYHLVSETETVKNPSVAQINARIRFGILASLGKGAKGKKGQLNKSAQLVKEYARGPVDGPHREKKPYTPKWAKEVAEWGAHGNKDEEEKLVKEIIKVIA